MFTSQCGTCNDTVGHGSECSTCKRRYHFGCGGISERGFNRLGSRRDKWICSNCRDTNVTHSEDASPSATSSRTPVVAKTTLGPKMKLSEVDNGQPSDHDETLKDILAIVTGLQTEFQSFHRIESDLKQVKADVADLKASLDSRIDDISDRVSNLESRISAVENAKTELDHLKKIINVLVEDNNRSEQWVRRSNIQINGIPFKSGENLINVTKRLADRCSFPLKDTDIDFVTRIAVKDHNDKRPKPIILKMQSRYRKDEFLAAIRNLKNIKASDLGFGSSDSRVYANDHLSTKNKFLLRQAKMKSKEKNYAFCWVRNCTIMVRKNETSPVLHINSEDSLKKIT
ncbi:unnamed protein product [Diatraea saccharalis]|uniref:PHD-type domain-containing protein n=1 Tax=Diatraea saccharalis TaxID=40085 RepID=A0A9N9QUB3_9NEOP|nr:unnamed protein product [Diatraea saccharalis]